MTLHGQPVAALGAITPTIATPACSEFSAHLTALSYRRLRRGCSPRLAEHTGAPAFANSNPVNR
jgi:hypothetical protein